MGPRWWTARLVPGHAGTTAWNDTDHTAGVGGYHLLCHMGLFDDETRETPISSIVAPINPFKLHSCDAITCRLPLAHGALVPAFARDSKTQYAARVGLDSLILGGSQVRQSIGLTQSCIIDGKIKQTMKALSRFGRILGPRR